MIFGTLNPEKIWHENLTDVPTSPVRCSHFTLGNQKVIFNSIIHTYLWLFMLSQKKTNWKLLALPTWKFHHSNLWNAKLFHLTEGLLHSFKRWSSEESKLWVVIGGSEKNRLWCVVTGMSCKPQQVFRVTTFWINTCFQSFLTLISCTVHGDVLQFSPRRNKPLPQASTCPYQYTCSSCSVPEMQ